MYREIIFFLLFLLTILFLMPRNVLAWGGHKEVTYYTIRDIEWINSYPEIKITPFTYQDPDKRRIPYSIPYMEGNIGDTTDAITILTTYCEEPDWGLDKYIDSKFFKILEKIGLDSSSWRHGCWVMFGGLLKLGGAVERFVYYYNMSIFAFKNNDPYWGFRFLARGLHYLEDVTQPQHTYPVPYRVILENLFDTKKIIQIASNHHFTLERYQGYQYRIGNPKFIMAVTLAEPIQVNDAKSLIEDAIMKSYKKAESIWSLQSKIYGPEIDRPTEFQWYIGLERDELLVTQYDNIILEQMSDLSSRVKGLLLHIGKIVEGLLYPVYERSPRGPVKQFISLLIAKSYTPHLSRSRRIINNGKIYPSDKP